MTTVASAAGAALLTLVGAYNLIFNASGFVDRLTRLHAVVGPAGHAFRMFPATLTGQWSLAVATATQLGLMLGVGGVVFVMVGGVAIARGAAPRPPAWFALAAASYYCALIMPIGFIYDRFLLPLAPLLAVPAGIGLVTLLDVRTGPVLRRVARAFAAILVVSLLWRAVSVDAMLITDSRYAAELWLRDHVRPDDLVATIGEPIYLPRLPGPHQSITPDISVVLQLQPQFIVVNADYLPRFAGRANVEGWLLWLQSLGGYRELYRVKTRLWWSALNWDSRFTDRREDGFTNLDKANPEIVIFGRPRR
jgi:hypothetical protein